jgi:hypothetical protein
VAEGLCRSTGRVEVSALLEMVSLATDKEHSVGDIVAAGKRHNATPEDIYGCMYFFLTEQLREFADRLSKFQISFKLFASDASALATTLREDAWSDIGLPSSVRFDRIAVSNILDKNYVGLGGTLTKWAPLLASTKHAAIVGYFMNWPFEQKDGRCVEAGHAVARAIIAKMKDVPYVSQLISAHFYDPSMLILSVCEPHRRKPLYNGPAM